MTKSAESIERSLSILPELEGDQWSLVEKITTSPPDVKVDNPYGILVFGASYVDFGVVEQTFHSFGDSAPILLVGGKVGVINQGKEESDKVAHSVSLRDELTKRGNIPSDKIIILDDESTNTREDVLPLGAIQRFSQYYLGENQIRQIAAIAKVFHLGRAWLTLEKQLPGVDVKMYGYNLDLHGEKVVTSLRDTGYRSLIWGEFQRIIRYSTPTKDKPDPDIASVIRLSLTQVDLKNLETLKQVAEICS